MMEMSRRGFLKTLGALGSYAALSPVAKAAEAISGPSYGTGSEYSIVSGVSMEDLGVLEESLTAPEPEPFTYGEDIGIDTSGIVPEIIYHLDHWSEAGNPDEHVRPRSMGTAFILNERGFWLTAAHVIDDYAERRDNGDTTLLVYDPQNGFAIPGRLLAFSSESDVALGKVEIPRGYTVNIPRTAISRNPVPDLGKVFYPKYANRDYIERDLLFDIAKRQPFGISISNPSFALTREPGTDLGYTMSIATIVDFVGESSSVRPDGQVVCLSNGQPGDSGAPVFDFHGNIAGVVTGMGSVFDVISEGDVDLTTYTGSHKVRDLLEEFIRSHGSRG